MEQANQNLNCERKIYFFVNWINRFCEQIRLERIFGPRKKSRNYLHVFEKILNESDISFINE